MRYIVYCSGRALDVIFASDQRDADVKASELHGPHAAAWSAQCDPWSYSMALLAIWHADKEEAACTGVANNA